GPMPVMARKQPRRSGSAAMNPSAAIARSCAGSGAAAWRRRPGGSRFSTRRRGMVDASSIRLTSKRPSEALIKAGAGRGNRHGSRNQVPRARTNFGLGEWPRGRASGETDMRKGHISVAGLSVLFALGLAAWEVYFFWFAGSFKNLEGTVGLFGPD